MARPLLEPDAFGAVAQLTNWIAVFELAVCPPWAVKLPVTLFGAHEVTLNAFCPFGPVTVSVRLVSGTSGTLLNVTELLARLTAPSIVNANGAGNETAIVGVVAFPDSVTVPDASAMLGTSGEVAAAVPIVQVVPARHGSRR